MADDDSSLEDCSDIFLRLRFFLSGFDSDTYDQLSVALEQNGGVNMEEFDASCTHVVVSKSVLWDDPICEIARKNGKFLVTEIWVSDCLELGVIADVNHVVYRPLRDSKGIPGSDDLVVCLTGYQNQARTNVMRMVYLMGAKFSKPLVAINVTHLVCYKFEGPKFILAKQIGLKLVNHKWLEDCLKSWSILSEEDYMNSGVEAELLEAEVNDFEDNGSSRVKATSEHRISDIAAGVCESGKQEFVSTNRVAVNGTLNSSGVEAFKLTPARCAEAPVQNLISDPQTVKYEVDTTVAENILIDDESGNFHRGDPARKHPISRTEETLGKICLDHVECTSGDMKTHEKPCGPARCVEAPVQNLISDPQTVKYEVDTTVAENILIDDESGNFHRGDPARKHPISRTEETLGKICLDHVECTSGDMKTHEKPCGPARCVEAPVQNLISDPQTVKYEVDTTVAENILIDDESGNFHRGDPARKHPISRTEETLGKICLDHVECTSGDMKTHEKPCGPARCAEAPVQNLISDPQTVKYEVDTTVAENILIDDESGNFHRGDPARKHPISRTEETLGKICLDHAECTSGDMKTHEKPCGESTNSEQIFSTRKSEAVSSPKTNRIKTYSSPVTTNNAHSKENNKSESSPAKVVSVVGVNNSKMASSCSDDLLANEHTHTNEFKISDVNIVKNIDVQATPCCNINLSKEISGHMQIEENYETSSYPSFLHKHEPLNKSNVVANAISVGQSQLKGTKKRKSLTDSSLETVVGYHLECIENTSSRLIDTNIAIPSDIHVVLPGHTNVMTNGVGCVTPVDRSEMKGNRKRKSRETSIVKDLDDTSHTECMISTPFSVAISKSTGHSSGSIKSSSLEKLVSFDVTFPHSMSKTAKINENVLDAVIKDCEKEDENEVHADYKKYNGKKHDRDMLVERAENSTKVSKKQATVSANRLQHAELNSHEREELEKKGKVISNRRKKTPLNDNQDDCIIQKKPVKSSKAVAPKRRDAKNYMAIDATFRDKENVVTSQGRETKSLSKISKTGSVLKDSTKVLTFPSKCMLPNSAKQTCFALSGRKQEIKPFHAIVKRLGGKLCRESHQWSHQTTHLITVGQLRRTEKFFAAAAAGRWILQDDYLKDSADAGVFLDEKKYEWYGSGMTEDGSICLEAPRKWREQRENSGCCALEGLRILLYGECIIPSLDTLKRAIRAGGAELLATSPPYTRFLGSGVHVAIVSPGTPKADFWVQEFLNHNLACVTTDFFVSFVCKPNLSLDQHVLYDSFSAVEKVVAQLKSNERAEKKWIDADACDVEEIRCSVCGSSDREDVMLLCGDDIGNGCGIAMHTDCCKPPLSEVPVNDWFCVQCTKPALLQPKKKTKRKVV